jgi:hypothetical protein
MCFGLSFNRRKGKHLDQCLLSLFQDEAMIAGSDSENGYATAAKQSTKEGFASAKAFVGSFSPPVD